MRLPFVLSVLMLATIDSAAADCRSEIVSALGRVATNGPVKIEAEGYRDDVKIHLNIQRVPGQGYYSIIEQPGHREEIVALGDAGWRRYNDGAWSEMRAADFAQLSGMSVGESSDLHDTVTAEHCTDAVFSFTFGAEQAAVPAVLEVDPVSRLPRTLRYGREGRDFTLRYDFDHSFTIGRPVKDAP